MEGSEPVCASATVLYPKHLITYSTCPKGERNPTRTIIVGTMADLRKSRAQALPTWGKAEKRPVAELNPTSAWPHRLVPGGKIPRSHFPPVNVLLPLQLTKRVLSPIFRSNM